MRGFGLKIGVVTRKGFEGRIRELVTGHITLERIAGAMLSARATLKVEYEKLHKIVLTIVREDAVCRRLMTVPSVGPIVAITYNSAMDDPNRIAKSKAAGALFGLTPKKYQSGEKDVTGGITRAGDEMVRTALYEAANVLLARINRFSKFKRWGMDVAKRRSSKHENGFLHWVNCGAILNGWATARGSQVERGLERRFKRAWPHKPTSCG